MSADIAPSASERVPTDPRLSRRRRAVERLRRRRIAARAVVGSAALAALWLALWSPLLRVRAVELVGARHTTAQDVARAARLSIADNLLLLSTGDVAARTENLPWVRSAKVERRLPGTVRVSVTERRPELILVTRAGLWTLDARARVLAAGRKGTGLPVLRVGASETPVPGDVVSHTGARAALRTYRRLRPGMQRRVEEVLARTPERIAFRLKGGTLVRWGGAGRLGAKRAVLRALFDRVAREGRTVAYVDVSVPESPAVSSVAFGTSSARRDDRARGRRRSGARTNRRPRTNRRASGAQQQQQRAPEPRPPAPGEQPRALRPGARASYGRDRP